MANLTLITAAVTAEATPLVAALGLQRDQSLLHRRIVYTGTYRGHPIALIITGMGPSQAAHVVDTALRRIGPSRVLISGTAGAVDPELSAGALIAPRQVVEMSTGTAHEPTWSDAVDRVLYTCDHVVATPAEKAELGERGTIDAIDMETAAIARLCEHYDTPWLCVRAICDEADMAVPAWSASLVNARGRPRVMGAIGCLLRGPHRLPAMLRLGRAAKLAAASLARDIPGRLV